MGGSPWGSCTFGGNWNNGANYGPFYENWNNSPSDSNINRGDRAILIFKFTYPGRKAESHTKKLASKPIAEMCWRVLKDVILWVVTQNYGM